LSARRLTTFALLIAILPLLGWWATGLFDIDEGFYGAVVAEMNRRHEWVTPYYNGQPWFEKPILLYWLAKPCLMAFGDQWGPRLPSVLTAIGVYALMVWACRRRLSDLAGTWSVLILGSSLVFVALGRLMMTDMPLALALSAAMLTFWESLVGDRRWRLLTAALLGVAVLAKGPVALILFALVAGWTFWKQPALRPSFRGQWLLGTAILAGVIAIWYVPAYLASGDLFVQKFLIEQNVGRFTGGDKAHTIKAAWAYVLYVPVVLFGMMPWSFWLGKAWPRKGAEAGPQMGDFPRYLSAWATITFLFFSISSAKLPHYILPMFVPLAMLLGDHFARAKAKLGLALAVAWTVIAAVVANFGQVWWYEASGQREAHEYARYIRENSPLGYEDSVAVFQMPRRDKSLGTGKPKLQETSLPSLLMYLDRDVNEAETVQEVVDGKSHWLLTRKGRITPSVVRQFRASGKSLAPVGPAPANYELYEVKTLVISGQAFAR